MTSHRTINNNSRPTCCFVRPSIQLAYDSTDALATPYGSRPARIASRVPASGSAGRVIIGAAGDEDTPAMYPGTVVDA